LQLWALYEPTLKLEAEFVYKNVSKALKTSPFYLEFKLLFLHKVVAKLQYKDLDDFFECLEAYFQNR
jgi:hypothetical protein